jgi:hypothetical protein
LAEQVIQSGSQRFVDDCALLEIVIREEINLVEEIPNVDAAQWIHLTEWQYTGECELFGGLVGRVPGHGHNLVIFFETVDGHRHVVVCVHNLEEVFAETGFEKFGVLGEKGQEEIMHCCDGVAPFLY